MAISCGNVAATIAIETTTMNETTARLRLASSLRTLVVGFAARHTRYPARTVSGHETRTQGSAAAGLVVSTTADSTATSPAKMKMTPMRRVYAPACSLHAVRQALAVASALLADEPVPGRSLTGLVDTGGIGTSSHGTRVAG